MRCYLAAYRYLSLQASRKFEKDPAILQLRCCQSKKNVEVEKGVIKLKRKVLNVSPVIFRGLDYSCLKQVSHFPFWSYKKRLNLVSNTFN